MGELKPAFSPVQQALSNVIEAKARAAAVRAALTPEQLAKVKQLEDAVPQRLAGWFMGPPNEKGRQYFYYATPEEVAEYYSRHT